jgi:hypothetical protein
VSGGVLDDMLASTVTTVHGTQFHGPSSFFRDLKMGIVGICNFCDWVRSVVFSGRRAHTYTQTDARTDIKRTEI